MQTATFKNDLDNAAQEPGLSRSRCLHHLASTNLLLAFAGGPANAGSTGIRRTGQGSRDAGSMSGQCLLQLLHMDSGIHHVHALLSLWPAMLVAPRAALRVSTPGRHCAPDLRQALP